MGVGKFVAILALAFLFGCSSEPDRGKTREVVEIRVEPLSLSLVVGNVIKLEGAPLDALGRPIPGLPLSFTSKDPSVAAVDSRGWVEGMSRGGTSIAVAAGGKEVLVPLSVRLPVGTIVIHPGELELVEGESAPLEAKIFDVEGERIDPPPELRWSSRDAAIASVDQDGRALARKAGKTDLLVASGEGTGEARILVLPRAHRITFGAPSSTLHQGGRLQLSATAFDRRGAPIVDRSIGFRSSAPEVASIQGGILEARAPGKVEITAYMDDAEASVQFVVLPRAAKVEIEAETSEIHVGGVSPWAVRALDAGGNVLQGARILWATSDPAVATVDAGGVVRGIAPGIVSIRAVADDASDLLEIRVLDPAVLSPVEGLPTREEPGFGFVLAVRHLTPGGEPYPEAKEVRWSSTDPAVADVDASGNVRIHRLGKATVTARTGGLQVAWEVMGSLRFRGIATGDDFTCGVTDHGLVWCWGANDLGQLGVGEVGEGSFEPVRIHGPEGIRFRSITAGSFHACALSTDGEAHCWGDNRSGALGIQDAPAVVPTPAPSAPGERFATLSAGAIPKFRPAGNEGAHTCGLTTSGQVLCWGNGRQGQLGNGAAVSSTVPVEPSGERTFVDVQAGAGFTCGIGDDGRIHCWGFGPLGRPLVVDYFDPETGISYAFFSSLIPHDSVPELFEVEEEEEEGEEPAEPVEPVEPPSFIHLAVGRDHVCGILAPAFDTYCWGGESSGKLGGSGFPFYPPPWEYPDLRPVCVRGVGDCPRDPWVGLALGGGTSCGIDAAGKVSCWGKILGRPESREVCSKPDDPEPRIAFAERYEAVSLSRASCVQHGCLLRDGQALCWGDNPMGQAGVGSGALIPSPVPIHPE